MATYYWVGGDGTWNNTNTANWSTSSGGAGGSGPPVAADTVNFDTGSGTGTCTTAATAAAANIIVNTSTLTLKLGANLTIANRLTLTLGTVDLNNYSLTINNFSSTNSNTRAILFGTGDINLTGNGGTVWSVNTGTGLTYTGTPTVNLTYAGGTGTRSVGSYTTSEAAAFSFNVIAGTDTFKMDGRAKNLNMSGFSGTYNGAGVFTIYGDIIFGAGITMLDGAGLIVFSGTTGNQNITSNGKVFGFNTTVNGVGTNVILQDDFAMAASQTFTLTYGTFNANNKNVILGSFVLGSGTKTLTLGNGTWTIAGSGTSWNANTNVTGLTVSASTGTINMTSGSAKTFAGGGQTWPTLNQGGSGALTISGSNTFANITNTVQPATITLTAGTTQTVTNFSVTGTSGNLITLNSSSSGSRATISRASGLTNVSYVNIKDISATGVAFYSYLFNGNVNSGNNTGIRFNLPDTSFIPSLFI